MSRGRDVDILVGWLEGLDWSAEGLEADRAALIARLRAHDLAAVEGSLVDMTFEADRGVAAAAKRLLALRPAPRDEAQPALAGNTNATEAPVATEGPLRIEVKAEARRESETEEFARILAEIIRRGLLEKLRDRSMTSVQALEFARRFNPEAFGDAMTLH